MLDLPDYRRTVARSSRDAIMLIPRQRGKCGKFGAMICSGLIRNRH